MDRILYRLIDEHPRYGTVGRAYEYDHWRRFPYGDRALFEKVNVELTDYKLKEDKETNELYLID